MTAEESRHAPDGYVWVCCACGKTAKDRYGPPQADYGWDVSCTMNSALFAEAQVVREGGRVVRIKENVPVE